MTEIGKERFYHLLPAIYRLRDQKQGEPLRALMAGLESEFLTVEADIDRLYDNWFIETCDEWVIPYIADLLGVYESACTGTLFSSQRRQVANVLGYRRRKGLLSIVEHALQDVSGWRAHVLEYSRLLAATQHLANGHADRGRFVDLHDAAGLVDMDGPFETVARSADIRRIGSGVANARSVQGTARGKYQAENVGVFLWRLQSYPMTNVPAGIVTRNAATGRLLPRGCFTFDPLRRDMSLFHQPQTLADLTQPVTAGDVPGPISRLAFASDIQAYRARSLQARDETPDGGNSILQSLYYGPDRSVCVILDGKPIPLHAVVGADLSQWRRPSHQGYREGELLVAIDVALGRLLFLERDMLTSKSVVEVNYSYGFSADLGGGPYARDLPSEAIQDQRINVLKGGKVDTLQKALAQWEKLCSDWTAQHSQDSPEVLRCTIHIVDNGTYADGDLHVNLPERSSLVIEATSGMRPIIMGNLAVQSVRSSGHLLLHGLLIEGKLTINNSLNLEIAHCTLMSHGLEAPYQATDLAPLQVTIDHSIVGPIHLHSHKSELSIRDSIVDCAAGEAIHTTQAAHALHSVASLERVTIFGRVELQELRVAQDVIFTAPVLVKNRRAGLVGFSYVPAHSETPPRESCVSDVEVEQQGSSSNHANEIRGEQPVYPLFTSSQYGDPGYAQLDIRGAEPILRGASNGAEMGVFSPLLQPQRRDNIAAALDEYLPAGLSAGVFYVT